MPRHGESIYKRNDGRWEGRYVSQYLFSGKPKYTSVYGKTYAEVKTKMEADKTKEDEPSPLNTNMERICTEWLDNVQIRIKDSSYARFYSLIHNHILPQLGTVSLKNLSNETINRYIKEKTISGRLDGKGGLSPKTVNDLFSLLIQIMQFAEKKGYIPKFDCDVTLPKSKHEKLPILTPSEQEKLIDYAISKSELGTSGILIALYTGVRLGELCALKWSDINFDTGVLSITKALQRIKNLGNDTKAKTKIIIDSPKSVKSIRDIPVPSSLLNFLKKFKGKYSPDCYILSGNKKYVEPRSFQDKFKKHLINAGIADINFHATRHTFATVAVEKGFDIKSLSEILGHSSVRFTLERYVHSSHELKKSSMEDV